MTTEVVNIIHRSNYDVYIGRPSKWGNPFIIGTHGTREQVIAKYEEWIRMQPELLAALPELKDKKLACFCRPLHSCHGDVLIKLLKELESTLAFE